MGRVDFELGVFDPEDYAYELDGLSETGEVEGSDAVVCFRTAFSVEHGLPRDELFDLDSDGGRFVTAMGQALRERILAMDVSAVSNKDHLRGIDSRRTELEIDPLGGEDVKLMVGIARSLYAGGLVDFAEEILTIEKNGGRYPRWPNNPFVMVLLAEIYSRKKDMLKVIDLLTNEDGMLRFPDSLNVMNVLHVLLPAYNHLERYGDTVAMVDSINTRGDFFHNKEMLALYLLALYRQGLYDRVIQIYANTDERILSSVIDRGVLKGFAIDLHRAGKHDQVCAFLLPFAKTEPYYGDPRIISTLTSSLNGLHRYQESLDLLMDTGGDCRFPNDPYCIRHMLYCLIYLERFAEASRMVQWLKESGRLKRFGSCMNGAINYLELRVGRARQKLAGLTERV